MYYLLGGSGVPNYGDELMAGGWLRYLAREKPNARVVIDTNLPSVSTLMLQPQNWRASHVSVVKSLALESPLTYFWQNFERGYKFFARGGFSNHPRIAAFDRYLREATTFHLFGGGYISKKWPHTGFLLGFAGAAQAEYGLRVVGTGIGLTPIESPPGSLQRTVKRVFDRFEFFESRDPSSHEFISKNCSAKAGMLGLDDSFLEPVQSLADGDPVLHVSCFMKEQNLEDFVSSLLRRRKEIERRFSAIKFWVCAPHRDMDAFENFKKAFPNTKLASLEEILKSPSFCKDDVMITTRFHPHMIAARSGIRGYYCAIPGRYYADKHSSVCALGSRFLPFTEFDQRGFDLEASSEMASLDAARVSKKRGIASQIYA